MTKKMGRPTIKGEPLTNAEKKRRYNAKLAIKTKVAEDSGFISTAVLISKKQLTALRNLSFLAYGVEIEMSGSKINDVIFYGLKMYLKNLEGECGRWNNKPPTELVDKYKYSDEDSSDWNNLSQIEIATQEIFKLWEISQANQEGNNEKN